MNKYLSFLTIIKINKIKKYKILNLMRFLMYEISCTVIVITNKHIRI